jgi:hypothetical protein
LKSCICPTFYVASLEGDLQSQYFFRLLDKIWAYRKFPWLTGYCPSEENSPDPNVVERIDDFEGKNFKAWLIVPAVTLYLRYPDDGKKPRQFTSMAAFPMLDGITRTKQEQLPLHRLHFFNV